MSLTMCKIHATICVLIAVGSAQGQVFTDQGMLSGSGLMIVPTATISPMSEMQVQFSHLGIFQGDKTGLNIFSLNCGFSSCLEGYARLTSEQLRTVSPEISYSFGGKFRFPRVIPVLQRIAIWGETTTSDMAEQAKQGLFPIEATRAGITASLDSIMVHPTFFVGITNVKGDVWPLLGGGMTIALSHTAQMGFEVVRGYFTMRGTDAVVTGSLRIFSNTSIHLSPGYLSDGSTKSWMLSAGISLTTVDVDYHPEKVIKDLNGEYTLPTIEDMEKQPKQEKER